MQAIGNHPLAAGLFEADFDKEILQLVTNVTVDNEYNKGFRVHI